MIFFGSSKFVIPIIETLEKNFDLKLVLTTERLAFQGDALEAPVINYCVENKIPYLSVSNLSDSNLKSSILNLKSDAAVLADFGLIIPPAILNLFSYGIINIHPSLLPKYRGSSPVQTAILNGDKTTGVSIIKLDEGIDHGPILAKAQEEISPRDTSESLYERLFKKGANLLSKTLKEYLENDLKLIPQDHKKATLTNHLTRNDGFIDISSSSLKIKNYKLKITRLVRAYYPWPGVWFKTEINGKEKIVKLLPENKIQVEGKKPVKYKDFLNGYPGIKQRLGKMLEQLV